MVFFPEVYTLKFVYNLPYGIEHLYSKDSLTVNYVVLYASAPFIAVEHSLCQKLDQLGHGLVYDTREHKFLHFLSS